MSGITLLLNGKPVATGSRAFTIEDDYVMGGGRGMIQSTLHVDQCNTDLSAGEITGSLFGAKFKAISVINAQWEPIVCHGVETKVYSFIIAIKFEEVDDA